MNGGTNLTHPSQIHHWNKRIFLPLLFWRISWKLNPGVPALGGSVWREVGCAPRDVSWGVCGWKEVLSGKAKGLERRTDGRTGEIWRELPCDWVNNLTDVYGRVSRYWVQTLFPKRCLLSHSSCLHWDFPLLSSVFLFSFCSRKFRSEVKKKLLFLSTYLLVLFHH